MTRTNREPVGLTLHGDMDRRPDVVRQDRTRTPRADRPGPFTDVSSLVEATRAFIGSTVLPVEDEFLGDIAAAGGDQWRLRVQEGPGPQESSHLTRRWSGAGSGAGSDPSALTTSAVKTAGGWRISGRKRFITGADGAGFFSSWPARLASLVTVVAQRCSLLLQTPLASRSVDTSAPSTSP